MRNPINSIAVSVSLRYQAIHVLTPEQGGVRSMSVMAILRQSLLLLPFKVFY